MRYAIITDVHANVFALKAALKEIDELKPDKIICLGDIVGGGAYPDETVQLIKKRGDILCVKGNHDMFA
ncbi:MAG: metallophosphoesterase, partial [Clostridia bacterium]|nr:metallophosphoesterase [Clostridia bacterium]